MFRDQNTVNIFDSIKSGDHVMTDHNNDLPRILYADFIRAYAIIAVIVIHVSAPLVISYGSVKMSWWWTANIFNSFCRPSIPLFVMVSGLLLLDSHKNESISIFFYKRLKKIIIPFLVWGTIYLFWIAFVNETKISFSMMVREFIQGPIYEHFWFIYMILGLYLATPILREFSRAASKSVQIYFIVLWFMTVSIFPIIQDLFNLKIGLSIVVTTGYVGYFILGKLLHEITDWKIKLAFLFIIFTISWLITCIGSFMISDHSNFNKALYEYLSINVVCMSVSLFLIFKYIFNNRLNSTNNFFIKAMQSLSSNSLYIYLMHRIILETLRHGSIDITLNANTFHPLIGIPLTTLVVCSLCLMITILAKKLPLLKFIFP
jgi:surface polysaccharide O-acyltransferase-like enzyme